jgi:hypothetical protein
MGARGGSEGSDDVGEWAENGGIVEIASGMKTFGSATFRNVYYRVG